MENMKECIIIVRHVGCSLIGSGRISRAGNWNYGPTSPPLRRASGFRGDPRRQVSILEGLSRPRLPYMAQSLGSFASVDKLLCQYWQGSVFATFGDWKPRFRRFGNGI